MKPRSEISQAMADAGELAAEQAAKQEHHLQMAIAEAQERGHQIASAGVQAQILAKLDEIGIVPRGDGKALLLAHLQQLVNASTHEDGVKETEGAASTLEAEVAMLRGALTASCEERDKELEKAKNKVAALEENLDKKASTREKQLGMQVLHEQLGPSGRTTAAHTHDRMTRYDKIRVTSFRVLHCSFIICLQLSWWIVLPIGQGPTS